MTVANLSAEAEELRQLIREARGAVKDLRAAQRTAERTVRDLARERVEHHLDAQVRRGLEEFSRTLDQAIKQGTDAVFRRFDKIAATLLGETGQQAREGKEPLTQLAAKVARRREMEAALELPRKQGTP